MAEVCVRLCSSLVWEWGPIRCRQYDLRRFFKAMIICTQQSRGDVLQLDPDTGLVCLFCQSSPLSSLEASRRAMALVSMNDTGTRLLG